MKHEFPLKASQANSFRFLIGRDIRGNWVVKEESGKRGGIFVDEASAIRYAVTENRGHRDAISMASEPLDLMIGNTLPDQQVKPEPAKLFKAGSSQFSRGQKMQSFSPDIRGTLPHSGTERSAPASWTNYPRVSVDSCALTFQQSWSKILTAAPDSQTPIAVDEHYVDVWIALIDTTITLSAHHQVLNEDDLRELGEIRSAPARNSSMAARILLRIGLSFAVHQRVAPIDWLFERSQNGKLSVSDGFPKIHFSVAHTKNIAIVAVSRIMVVGVDVESTDQSISDQLFESFCCSAEQDMLNHLPNQQASREFLRLWTLKEAYTKMVGLGHSMNFSKLGFSLDSVDLINPSPIEGTHFETMFVTRANQLNHVAIAVGGLLNNTGISKLRVFSMTNDKSAVSFVHAPSITL
jgi:phosphopantetheinyl transferase